MRIAVGQIMQESNSFCPVKTSLQNFKDYVYLEDEEIPSRLSGTNTEVAGFLEVAAERNLEPVFTLATNAVSNGPVESATLDWLIERLLGKLEGPRTRIDGMYLILHGGMLEGRTGDGSGRILETVRRRLGRDVPLVASVDMHANLTERMLENCDALLVYHTFPHSDLRKIGVRASRILSDIISGTIRPRMAAYKIPMILPSEISTTDRLPALKMYQAVEELERQKGVLSASFAHMQPWLDASDVGCSTLVITDDQPDRADKEAKQLASLFWSLRGEYFPPLLKIEDAIRTSLQAPKGVFIILDGADAPSSGAPGDCPAILEELLRMKPDKPCYTMIVDPNVVRQAIQAGVGTTVSTDIGGKIDHVFARPIHIAARVKAITDGRFRNLGPTQQGVENFMGRAAVLVSGQVHVVVMEKPVFAWDAGLYFSVGLRPDDARIVVVKCPVETYVDLPRESLYVDSPGASSPNLVKLPFMHIQRPLYPFDDMKECVYRKIC